MIQNLHINLYAQKKAAERTFLRQLFYFLCIFFSIIFFSCKTTEFYSTDFNLQNQQNLLFPFENDSINWQKINTGIDYFTYSDKKNNIWYEVVRIDLKTKDLQIKTNDVQKNWQKSVNVKNFCKKNNCVVALNASPFKVKNNFGLNTKVQQHGIFIKNQEIIFEPNERYCALAFYKIQDEFNDFWKAQIFDNQNQVIQNNKNLPQIALGGFWTILRDDKIYEFKNIKETRTAVGLNREGTVLYILGAKNLSYADCAIIFKNLKCKTAMQFDGGFSSQIVINNKNVIPKFYNRKVCSVLGFGF